MRIARVFAVLAVVGALLACGKEAATSAAPAAPAAKSGSRTDVYTDPFRFGDAVDAEGVVVKETSVIPTNSLAAVSFYLHNVPEGTQVRVLWKDVVKNADVGEEVKPIGNKGFVSFRQPKSLPDGNYRVDMFFKPPNTKDWQSLGDHTFTVGGRTK
jgi:hypothetical protein